MTEEEKSKEIQISKIMIRLLGFVDLGVGLSLCTIFIPRFIRLMYIDKAHMFFKSMRYTTNLQLYSSVSIGIFLITAGVCLAFLKPLGIKIHNYLVLPLGAGIGLFFVTIGIAALLEYKYWVPFALRFVLFGFTVLIYSLTTYLVLNTEKRRILIRNLKNKLW